MEYLDIYDEEGNHIGKEERSIVHECALWHKTVHCWLYDKEGNIYFQIRSDKNKLYTTASGHVQAGESVQEAFGREIEEEIGYKIDYETSELVDVVKFIMDREEPDGSIFKDRVFANVYCCLFDGNLKKFDFQEEELNGIVKINAKRALEMIEQESGETKAERCYKENEEIKTKEVTIFFNDFLVNPGETAIEKYGEVLKYIIAK